MTRFQAKHITGSGLPSGPVEGVVRASKLTYAQRKGQYVWINGDHQPQATTAANSTTGASASGAPTGTAGDTNYLRFLSGNYALFATYFITGTQTILAPVYTAGTGINLQLDATDNEGAQYVFGGLGTTNPHYKVIGTSAGFFIRLKIKIADVSGEDLCEVGFRKQEAYATDPLDYNDKAGLNVNGGTVYSSTILTNAADVNTSTGATVADAGTVDLEVRVSAAGVVTYFIGGVQYSTVAYTFTSALGVYPYANFRHDTTSPGAVSLVELEIGPLSERERD